MGYFRFLRYEQLCDGFHTYDVIYFIAHTITPIYTLFQKYELEAGEKRLLLKSFENFDT